MREVKHWRPGRCITAFCRRKPKGRAKKCSTCSSRDCRQRDGVRYSYNNLKVSAARRGIPFLLTLEEFREFCTATRYILGKGRRAESYTVDRIKEGGPYSRENIQVLTKSANVRKFRGVYHYERGFGGWVPIQDRQPEPGDPF